MSLVAAFWIGDVTFTTTVFKIFGITIQKVELAECSTTENRWRKMRFLFGRDNSDSWRLRHLSLFLNLKLMRCTFVANAVEFVATFNRTYSRLFKNLRNYMWVTHLPRNGDQTLRKFENGTTWLSSMDSRSRQQDLIRVTKNMLTWVANAVFKC